MDINSVGEELYSLQPEEFTAARNLREREAKAIGDAELAASIHQLRKPSMGAWLANQLVRAHPAEVQSFVDLGAALREATAMLSGDQLRELGKQRRQLVHALMQQIRALANAAGHNVSQDTARRLEDTLHAALADQRASEQLKAGRLTDTLAGEGFPSTAEGQDRAQAVAERAKVAAQEAAVLVSRLRAELDEAEIEASLLEQQHRSIQAELDRANRTVHMARRRLDEAVQRQGGLSQ